MVSKSDWKTLAMLVLIGGGAYFAFTSYDMNQRSLGLLGVGAGVGLAVAPYV